MFLRPRCSYCGVKYLALGPESRACPRCRPIVKVAILLGRDPAAAVRKDVSTTAGIVARVKLAMDAGSDALPMTEEECFRGL